MAETTLFDDTDDVTGNTHMEAWTNTGSDLHIVLTNVDTTEFQSIYIRNGEAFAKAILKAAWA